VFLLVEQDTALTDTFAVVQGPALELPGLGPVSLAGVLRSEVEAHLRDFVGRFVRTANVRVRSFVRIGIAGEVTSPGYYLVPTDLVLADALRVAGGVTADGEISNISVRRNDDVVWDAASLVEALSGGRTIDQLDVRTGDQIVVARRGRFAFGGIESPLRAISILFAIPLTIAGVVTLF
jgi:protein involved in polysaccharide export with SLBB domain